jgi:hypothetical protein
VLPLLLTVSTVAFFVLHFSPKSSTTHPDHELDTRSVPFYAESATTDPDYDIDIPSEPFYSESATTNTAYDISSEQLSLYTSRISLLHCPQNAHRPSTERLADFLATMQWNSHELLSSQAEIGRFASAMNSMDVSDFNRVLPGQSVS